MGFSCRTVVSSSSLSSEEEFSDAKSAVTCEDKYSTVGITYRVIAYSVNLDMG